MNSLQRSLLAPVILLTGISMLTIHSIAPALFYAHLLWIAFGIGLVALFHRLDVRPYLYSSHAVYALYGLSIILLVATLFFAPEIRGHRSWLVVGPLHFQTSEFAKVALIIILAYFFAREHATIADIRTIGMSALLAIIPAGLVLLQPDTGSAIVLLALWFGFLLLSGLKLRHLMVFVLLAVLVGAVGWTYLFADYQKERILLLFDPDRDPLGVGYSVLQSKIAIGSAGFFGKGYGQGTQAQLGFLPEAHTDLIFSAFVEEWGVIGGLVFFLLFVYLVFIVLKIGLRAEQNVARFIALGAATVFVLHTGVNIGSALGLLPVIGVPLTFMSYGGSHLLVSFFLVGILYALARRTT